MNSAHLIAAIIGVILSVSIIILTRRDHLSPLVAARWLLIACLVLIISLFPTMIDKLGDLLGIGYPPVIPIIVALGAAMLKILLMDIAQQKMRVKLDRVVQKLAIIEKDLDSK